MRLLEKLDDMPSPEEEDRIRLELDRMRAKLTRYASPQKAASDYRAYPSLSNPRFNDVLFWKKEFQRFRSLPQEALPSNQTLDEQAHNKCGTKSFRLMAHQAFVDQYLNSAHTPYRSMLLYHGVGVGKTCTAIRVAERYLDTLEQGLGSGKLSPDQRVLVILPTNLKDNFRKQLFDIEKVKMIQGRYALNETHQCMGSKYMEKVPKYALLPPGDLDKRVRQVISTRYHMMGFVEFANFVERMRESIQKTDVDEASVERRFQMHLRHVFSNRLMIIDEVQNVRTESEESRKLVPPILMRVLQHGQNNKLLLMTATPMYNDAHEIVFLLNMLLANDKRPLIKNKDLFKEASKTKATATALRESRIQELFRGYVSYMRSENPLTFPKRFYPGVNRDPQILSKKEIPGVDIKGKAIPADQRLQGLEIVKSVFGKVQRKVYKQWQESTNLSLLEQEEETEATEEKSHSQSTADILDAEDGVVSNTLQRAVQISNIVYQQPDTLADITQTYGEKGFSRVFKRIKGDGKSAGASGGDGGPLLRVKYDPKAVAEAGGYHLSPELIGEYAAKMKTIVDRILNSDGIVYVYSFYLHSGIIPLAIALEHVGFANANGTNVLVWDNPKKAPKPFYVKPGVQAKYAFLSRNKSLTPDFDKQVQRIRGKANQIGEDIKVILGTSVSAEGIDFKRIREIHLLEPWYHLNRIEQIIGRAIRNCSHIDLPIEKRNVTVYHHASVTHETLTPKIPESIDLRIYKIATNKQVLIEKVEQALQSAAVDCMLHKDALQSHYVIPKAITSQGTTLKKVALGGVSKSGESCAFSDPHKHSAFVDTSTFDPAFYEQDQTYYERLVIATLAKQTHRISYSHLLDALRNEFQSPYDEEMIQWILSILIAQGKVLYLSDKYSLPSKTPGRSIEDVRVRVQLSDALLDLKPISQKRSKKEKLLGTDADVDSDSDEYDTEGSAGPLLAKLEKMFHASLQRFLPSARKHFYTIFVDAFLDQLPLKAYMELCRAIVKYPSEFSKENFGKELYNSMERGSLALKQGSETTFYIPHQETFRIFASDGTHEEIAPIQRPKLLDRLRKTILPKDSELKGFMKVNKGELQFKIFPTEKRTTGGSVCSSSNQEFIQSRLSEDYKTLFDASANAKKIDLCLALQILYRAEKKGRVFARPLQYYLLKSA